MAIFAVCGEPNEDIRQCPLALDKWDGMIVDYFGVMLGLIWNTRALTVGVTGLYLAELHELLRSTWHKERKQFTIKEIAQLLGKCQHLSEGVNWVYHLITHMFRSSAFALRQNTIFLAEKSPNFKKHISNLKELRKAHKFENHQNLAHINFEIKKSAQMIHKCRARYNINKDMRAEIEFLTEATRPDSGINWWSPIAHMIPRDPLAHIHSDACLDSSGGYSIKLSFMWYLMWPEWVVKKTLRHLSNASEGDFISINDLEFASVIISFCGALLAIETMEIDDPYPVILAYCDNTSAVRWVTHACMGSAVGRALGRFFCGLLINSKVGINSRWLSTTDNVIADEISRLKKLTNDDPNKSINFSSLFQSFPQLQTCRVYQPSQELLSCIWQCLSTRSSPTPSQIKQLKQQGLGRLTL